MLRDMIYWTLWVSLCQVRCLIFKVPMAVYYNNFSGSYWWCWTAQSAVCGVHSGACRCSRMAISVCVTNSLSWYPRETNVPVVTDVLVVEVSVAWHPITLDFGNMQKEVEMCCRYFVENCFFNRVSWSFVANMNSFKHVLKYDHCFSVCLVSCFRKTCRALYIPVMLY
jgi:hypothetical protein